MHIFLSAVRAVHATSPDGFAAVKGWDPATGWGTPNFEALQALV